MTTGDYDQEYRKLIKAAFLREHSQNNHVRRFIMASYIEATRPVQVRALHERLGAFVGLMVHAFSTFRRKMTEKNMRGNGIGKRLDAAKSKDLVEVLYNQRDI